MEIKESAAIVREKELTKRTKRQTEIEREKQKQETERAEIAAKSEREIGLNKLTLRELDFKILQEKQKCKILEKEAQQVQQKSGASIALKGAADVGAAMLSATPVGQALAGIGAIGGVLGGLATSSSGDDK